jgi:catechol 2,3-dioxygenase-like lactoylglutathione lyase family enzyme
MEILGLTFVASHTDAHAAMVRFGQDVLGLTPRRVEGMDATVFDLPDGTTFGVNEIDPGDTAERTVGFRVADVETAAAELRAAGLETDDEISVNDRYRYLHFRAPDGRLYELVEHRP